MTKPIEVEGESYVSLKMLEVCCQEARKAGADGSERVTFGTMNVDGTYSPYGPALALGFSDGHLMIVVRDSPIPVLPQGGGG